VRWVRVLASTLGAGTACACTLVLFAGTATASATTRLRSGNLHAQLVSHVTPTASPVPTDLSLAAANIMATVVGALALVALGFVVLTLIRRRIST